MWSPRPAAKASMGMRRSSEYTPRLDRVPPGFSARRADSNVAWVPSASMAASTPRPRVSFMISCTTSHWRKFKVTSAPILRAMSSR